VQDGEVPRESGYAVSAQAGEGPGDGPAHEDERRAVRGQADGVGPAADQGRRDACDEGSVVGEPPVHVGDPLDGEATIGQDRVQRGQPGISGRRQSRGLRPDACVVGGLAGHDATDAREPEIDIAGQVTGDGEPPRWVVAEEEHGRLPGQDREPGAGRGQLITPDRDQDNVVVAAGVRHHLGVGVDAPAAEYIAGAQACRGHFTGPAPVAQHRDLVTRGRNMGAVDGSDDARAHDERFHDEFP
jgi:hypothetical protein